MKPTINKALQGLAKGLAFFVTLAIVLITFASMIYMLNLVLIVDDMTPNEVAGMYVCITLFGGCLLYCMLWITMGAGPKNMLMSITRFFMIILGQRKAWDVYYHRAEYKYYYRGNTFNL
jgi:hypothetical protein